VNTNLRKTIGQITVALFTTLAFPALTPRAFAQGGIPLWTNRYVAPGGLAEPRALAADASGNVFVTGDANATPNGRVDFVTLAYSSAGVPLWTNGYDGTAYAYIDVPVAIAVDSSSNVIVTGASVGIGTGNGSGYDYATIKYSNAGVPLWTNRYDGPIHYTDVPNALATDSSGKVFVTGGSAISYSEPSAVTTVAYSSAGAPLWTNRFLYGFYNDSPAVLPYGTIMTLDTNGNVFVAGISDDNLSYKTVKYSNSGVPLQTNHLYYPIDTFSAIYAWVFNNRGDLFATGGNFAGRTNFDGTLNYDCLTAAYSATGAPLWTNRYIASANSSDGPGTLALDGKGNVIVVEGSYDSTNTQFHLLAYSSAGVPLWTNVDDHIGYGQAIAVDGSRNIIVGGKVAYSAAGVPVWTNAGFGGLAAVDRSNNFYLATSVPTGNGNSDIVVVKYSPIIVPIHLAIERDGSGGLFIRFTGAPDATYRLQRAASVTGTWTNLATNTAPASGLIEYHETSPPPGQAFYRAVQP
jgi:hypothetical protein